MGMRSALSALCVAPCSAFCMAQDTVQWTGQEHRLKPDRLAWCPFLALSFQQIGKLGQVA